MNRAPARRASRKPARKHSSMRESPPVMRCRAIARATAREARRDDSRPAARDALQRDARVSPREPTTTRSSATGVSAAPATTSASTALALSDTGRWLTDVHNRASAAAPIPRSAATPLVDDADAPPPALASALQRAVQSSGVFYESHLARSLVDDFPLASIADEPQATWATPTHVEPSTMPASLLQDADKLAVVARQLDTLETKTIVWSAAPWPGQQATIEIREDDQAPRGDAADRDAAQPAWRTRITLTLPSLGTVDATLALRGQSIELALIAVGTAHATLAAARDALGKALAARSLDLARFTIADADGR